MHINNNIIKISGSPEGFDADLIIKEVNAGKTSIHVCRDDKRLLEAKQALQFYNAGFKVLEFPAWDCLPYDRVSPSLTIVSKRISTLSKLTREQVNPFVVLTTVAAITQKTQSIKTIKETVFNLNVGKQLNIDNLMVYLVRMGFSKCSTVMEPGDYSLRGGIIDIFPPSHKKPIRLDLFGDTLETIRSFDQNTQIGKDQVKSVTLTPASEVILDEQGIENFRKNYRAEFGAPSSDDGVYESVTAGMKYQGLEHWLPFYYEELANLFDYLPKATIFLDEGFEMIAQDRWSKVLDQFDSRKEVLSRKRNLESIYKPIKPELLYYDYSSLISLLSQRRVLSFSAVKLPIGLDVLDAQGVVGRNFSPERLANNENIFQVLANHISTSLIKKPVILACFSSGSRERLIGLLNDAGLIGIKLISNFTEVEKGVNAVVWELPLGFSTENYLVISEQDVLGERLVRRAKKRRKAENFLSELTALSVNDLVVHIDHGLGRFSGLKTIDAGGAPHECIALEYSGGDRLFLPVENIELLSKYGQEVGILDKLGGSSWQSKKAKLKKRIKDMAERLIKVAADRELIKAPIVEPSNDMWEDFCARFPYNETEDQLLVMDSVIHDLGRGVPMDRLVCGDVGFGKTEIAMRAAFVMVEAGYQVAIIVPTTLLSRQHTLSFKERFRGFPFHIKQLSRFVNPKDSNDTREGILNGTVDIVIGTHALISDKVKFKKLGLVIVDEEQHFGVQHKEKLKQLKSTIHVLTLSATPIPRTLQLSLSGIRELSIIETPPVDRLAIRTYVTEFDTVVVREALLREKYRGGQSFFVVPRVSDIPEIEEFLKTEVPEVNYTVAHGQLPPVELDKRMNAFYDGQYNVLVATSIVESGIDVPTANTIVVFRSDMFGLSQLYQIRGRVGRSKTRAYAYLTTNPKKKITRTAQKRLKVLGNIDTLGAGFNIASQDMDIRGAGNILGEEQSGNVREVGYELYQSMLEETVAKIRAGSNGDLVEDGVWSPSISLSVPVLIPETYITDLDLRLGLYKRLAGLSSKLEIEAFAAELIDRFGPIPREVNTLLLVVRIKDMCKRACISNFSGGARGATIEFRNNKFPNPAGLADFISQQGGLAKVRDNKLIISRDWKSNADKIKGAFSIAKELAGKASN